MIIWVTDGLQRCPMVSLRAEVTLSPPSGPAMHVVDRRGGGTSPVEVLWTLLLDPLIITCCSHPPRSPAHETRRAGDKLCRKCRLRLREPSLKQAVTIAKRHVDLARLSGPGRLATC